MVIKEIKKNHVEDDPSFLSNDKAISLVELYFEIPENHNRYGTQLE